MNTIADKRENADDRTVKKGTVQHEISVDDKVKAFIGIECTLTPRRHNYRNVDQSEQVFY